MSIRAKVAGAVVRRLMKQRLASFSDVQDIRKLTQIPTRPIPKPIRSESLNIAGVAAQWFEPADAVSQGAMLYLHGGGYVFGGLDSHREIAWRLAQQCNRRVWLIDYGLAPEHPFPAAVDDAHASYQWLLEQGINNSELAIAGDSAGGGLALALALKLREANQPLPDALLLMSPWADLTLSGDSMDANNAADVMLSRGALQRFADIYLDGQAPGHPHASPLFADLSGLPRSYVMVGSGEVLRSDAERIVSGMQNAGGEATLKVWPDMMHVFPIVAGLIPEGKQAIRDMAEFLRHDHSE